MVKRGSIFRSNRVFLVFVPVLGAIHYSWYHMQFDETFVEGAAKKKILIPGTNTEFNLADLSFTKTK